MFSRFDVDMQALLHLTSVPVLSSGCFLHNLFFQHNTRHFAYIIYDSQFHICFRPLVWPTPGTNRTATHAWKLQLSRQLESSARHWGVWFDSANEFCSLQIRSPRVKTGIVWIPCCLWILILDVQPSIFACQEFQREKIEWWSLDLNIEFACGTHFLFPFYAGPLCRTQNGQIQKMIKNSYLPTSPHSWGSPAASQLYRRPCSAETFRICFTMRSDWHRW